MWHESPTHCGACGLLLRAYCPETDSALGEHGAIPCDARADACGALNALIMVTDAELCARDERRRLGRELQEDGRREEDREEQQRQQQQQQWQQQQQRQVAVAGASPADSAAEDGTREEKETTYLSSGTLSEDAQSQAVPARSERDEPPGERGQQPPPTYGAGEDGTRGANVTTDLSSGTPLEHALSQEAAAGQGHRRQQQRQQPGTSMLGRLVRTAEAATRVQAAVRGWAVRRASQAAHGWRRLVEGVSSGQREAVRAKALAELAIYGAGGREAHEAALLAEEQDERLQAQREAQFEEQARRPPSPPRSEPSSKSAKRKARRARAKAAEQLAAAEAAQLAAQAAWQRMARACARQGRGALHELRRELRQAMGVHRWGRFSAGLRLAATRLGRSVRRGESKEDLLEEGLASLFDVGSANWLYDLRLTREREEREREEQGSEGSEVDEFDYRYDPDEGYMLAVESDEAFMERIEAFMASCMDGGEGEGEALARP